ncbi:MAG: DEAD/DEAH box helicase [Kiritimatiellia bacterium]
MGEFHYPIGGKNFRSGKPTFFNRRKKRRHGGGGAPRHPGLAERDEGLKVPELPKDPPPAVYEANVFGKLDVRLQHAIGEVGYTVPTPIQEKAIPFLLEGRDLIGCAQTGTGKTAAFMLPILDRLLRDGPSAAPRDGTAGHPRALVLSPTRELAAQTAENVAKYSKYTGLPFAVVFGGVSQFPQVKALQRGAETVIATPGRLMDLMTQGVVFLDKVELFVLDEADRMLDMGFLPDIKRIISKLPPNKVAAGAAGHGVAGKLRQSLFFSATLSPEILKLAGELVHDPVQIMISPETPTVERINQTCMFVEKGSKDSLLIHLLKNHPEWYRVIVFARTRHGADRVEKKLGREDITVAAIHSDKTQNQRTRALKSFKEGKTRVLVATDIASRGIDVPEIDLVVNMELPVETESYVHRIGRTARAGESGTAISFVAPEERGLLRAVERYIRKELPIDRDQPFHSEAAERQSGKQGKGLPQAPWIRGGVRNKKGVARHPGSHFWGQPKKEKKFVHPANAKKAKRGRTSFQGRREPDFGQK